MARRRLLSILAASALFTVAFAGPATALDVVEETQDSVTEAAEETLEVSEGAIEAAEDVLETDDDEPTAEVPDEVEEPVEELTDVVEEAVTPDPSPSPSPSPSPAPSRSPSSSEEPALRTTTDTSGYDHLITAGDVDAAPSLASLTGTGGSAPGAQSSFDLPLAAPAAAPAAPTTTVEAPQVAEAPAEAAEAASVLAQPATSAVPADEGTPVLVLVALASLLAAGSATVREARLATID